MTLEHIAARTASDLVEEIASEHLIAIEARELRLVQSVAKDRAFLVEPDHAKRQRVELFVGALIELEDVECNARWAPE